MVQLVPWIEKSPECVSTFLRGFFDSEGSMDEKRTLTASNTNADLLKYVQHLLLAYFGIATTGPRVGSRKGSVLRKEGETFLRKSDCYVIRIRAGSLMAFRNKVGFTIARKRNRLDRACKGQ